MHLMKFRDSKEPIVNSDELGTYPNCTLLITIHYQLFTFTYYFVNRLLVSQHLFFYTPN